jgi:hypothetical protein
MSTWTEADLAALRAAVASGIQTVAYDGPPRRSITYQSLAEMRSLLASMQADVSSAAGTPRYRFVTTRKGF